MTLAHLWLSWAANLARDFERLHGAYGRVNTSPAGAAIMVGSDFPLNRERTAELLGFDSVHENCADAILELNADDSLETPAAVALLYHTLAKWADDLILWSTSEFGFVDIPDRFCNTSTIMMQKKNVIGPAEVKGASAEAIGCVVTSYHALKGPTGLPITERYYALEMLWRVADNACATSTGSASCCRRSGSARSTCASRRGATGRRRPISRARSCASATCRGARRTRSSASWCASARSAGSGPPT